MEEDLVFALTDLKICTIGRCATVVLCAVGLAYRGLRQTAIHISHQI
jgi:hypothetical protein